MRIVATAIALSLPISLFPVKTAAACDDLVGTIITKHLAPIVEGAGCPGPDKAGLDKPNHRLTKVCYESSGAASHIRIEATLNCRASDESVVSKLLGGKNAPSVSENISADADIRGSDCSIQSVTVTASGEVGKVITQWFDVNGKARQALDDALNEICKK